MLGPQAWGKTQHELNALELCEPIGGDGPQQAGSPSDTGGARGA